ncbi:hypothetical protein LYNGBM3L_45270 [Moorena producens 3L]|uniref:Uncharacterized protein n=1 Tax=Moorena producens 3L TaxID=489825 RepID=F4XX57_9CYAN|nr:hypothetical protein LYNGBM3L_45270 [Moorena producens 3L]
MKMAMGKMGKMGKIAKNLPKVGLTSITFQYLKIAIVLKGVGSRE